MLKISRYLPSLIGCSSGTAIVAACALFLSSFGFPTISRADGNAQKMFVRIVSNDSTHYAVGGNSSNEDTFKTLRVGILLDDDSPGPQIDVGQYKLIIKFFDNTGTHINVKTLANVTSIELYADDDIVESLTPQTKEFTDASSGAGRAEIYLSLANKPLRGLYPGKTLRIKALLSSPHGDYLSSYAQIKSGVRAYGPLGLWAPVGAIFVIDNKTNTDSGKHLAAIPINAACGARYCWSDKTYLGISVLGSLNPIGKENDLFIKSGHIGVLGDFSGLLYFGTVYRKDFEEDHISPGWGVVVGIGNRLTKALAGQ